MMNVDHVPFLTVNGEFNTSREVYVLDNLLQVICSTYKGSVRIAACGNPNILTQGILPVKTQTVMTTNKTSV